MKIIDCYWEKRNLNCSTVEVVVDNKDIFITDDFSFIKKYDYVVVKVPVNKLDFNFGLSQLGFSLIELQMDMYANLKTFNFEDKIVKRISPGIRFEEIKSEGDLNTLLSKITPGMFSTDRICLDPLFGEVVGCLRYHNWIIDEYNKKSAKIMNLIYNDKTIAFGMFKEEDNIRGLIGGLFSDYQDEGLGWVAPCFFPLYVKSEKLGVKKIINPISSNNKAVWDLYEFFGYVPRNPHYVFVKHNI